jgi:hypothetical protein
MLFGEYPYPEGFKPHLKGFFFGGMFFGAIGVMGLFTENIGLGLTRDDIRLWVAALVFASFGCFAALFIGMAVSIHMVNSGRDGKRQPFLVPTKFGTSQFEKPHTHLFFIVLFAGIGGFFLFVGSSLLEVLAK